MVRRTALPFLTIPDEAVRCDGFLIGDPGNPLQPADSVLDNWDYARDLRAGLDLQVDMEATANQLAIPLEELQLGIRLTAGTGSGNMPRSRITLQQTVLNRDSDDCSLRGDINSAFLSSRLLLEATIMLLEPSASAGALSPIIPGARLWQFQRNILLEGGGDSRFPIETLSFADSELFQNRPHQNAPWYFYWRPGAWSSDFSAVTRLYINADHDSISERVVDGDPDTLQGIMADVMSQVIESAINDGDGWVLEETWSDGTLGEQLCTWVDMAFPDRNAETIASMRAHRPGEFRAAILAAASVEE